MSSRALRHSKATMTMTEPYSVPTHLIADDADTRSSAATDYIRERDRVEWQDGFDAAMLRRDLSIISTREFTAGWLSGRRMSNELHMRGYTAHRFVGKTEE